MVALVSVNSMVVKQVSQLVRVEGSHLIFHSLASSGTLRGRPWPVLMFWSAMEGRLLRSGKVVVMRSNVLKQPLL